MQPTAMANGFANVFEAKLRFHPFPSLQIGALARPLFMIAMRSGIAKIAFEIRPP
jgi:hypothetical protein